MGENMTKGQLKNTKKCFVSRIEKRKKNSEKKKKKRKEKRKKKKEKGKHLPSLSSEKLRRYVCRLGKLFFNFLAVSLA